MSEATKTLSIHSLAQTKGDWSNTVWCGPAAISLITGRSLTDSVTTVKKAITEGLGKRNRAIKGLYNSETIEALAYLGYEVKSIYTRSTWKFQNGNTPCPSVARYLHRYKPMPGALWLLSIKRHYMVTDGSILADNMYHGDIAGYFRADCELEQIHEVTEISAEDLL